jgi:ABC-type antimicrobial peptide transport system permease subunit
MALAGLGVLIGIPPAFAATQASRSLFFGVHPADPIGVIQTISIVLLASATAACIPALRAIRIDPLEVMKG